jgi:transposase
MRDVIRHRSIDTIRGHPVRAVDVFVEALDLADMGFDGVQPLATGRPAYHPLALLKLYIYGYLNRVQSSRRLEREAGRNLEVMWLTGRLVPDHKTIADFRKDNGPAIKKVCAQFVALCRKMRVAGETDRRTRPEPPLLKRHQATRRARRVRPWSGISDGERLNNQVRDRVGL